MSEPWKSLETKIRETRAADMQKKIEAHRAKIAAKPPVKPPEPIVEAIVGPVVDPVAEQEPEMELEPVEEAITSVQNPVETKLNTQRQQIEKQKGQIRLQIQQQKAAKQISTMKDEGKKQIQKIKEETLDEAVARGRATKLAKLHHDRYSMLSRSGNAKEAEMHRRKSEEYKRLAYGIAHKS
jgi:hypothetical protein